MLTMNHAADAGECWSDGGGKSCCKEDHHTVLGAPPGTNIVAQAPSLVTDDGGTTYDVFAQGFDNAVWTRHFNGITWSDWVSLGGVTTSRPTAVAAGTGHLYVFARGGDNGVWYRERVTPTSSWTGWKTLGGYAVSGPGVAAWDSGEVEVFVHGGDHQLWKNSLIGTTPGGWMPLGGSALYGEPSAAHMTYADGGESIQVWVTRDDMQTWRINHDRVPMDVGFSTTTVDVWRPWKAALTGVFGSVGATEHSDAGFLHLAIRDAFGTVWAAVANATGVTGFPAAPPITTRSDVSIAPWMPNTPRYAYVDRDTSVVNEFHFDEVCSSCGDGRCYGTESCSTCATDCGACGPECGNGVCEAGESCGSCSDCGACPPPKETCQDYQFCKKTSLSPDEGGTPVTVHACNIADARKAADKKVIGGVLFDGPCPPTPSVCGGSPGVAVLWCCEDTDTTYFGAACKEADATKVAKLKHENCKAWTSGVCQLP